MCLILLLSLLVMQVLLIWLAYKQEVSSIIDKDSAFSIAKSNQAFSGKIFPAMLKANCGHKNLAASPFSLGTALAMLYAGTGGETAKQMRHVMALPEEDEVLYQGYEDIISVLKSNDNFTLEVANGLFIHDGFTFLRPFVNRTRRHFQASAETLDFHKSIDSAEVMNQWVKNQTHEKIKDLIPADSIGCLTRLILINAIYFKSNWAKPFDKSYTSIDDFHVSSTETIKVEMMYQWQECFFWETLGYTILSIPYKGDRLSMLFFLSNRPEGFDAMEKEFAAFDFAGMKFKQDVCYISIPKFKVETSQVLNEPLKRIGLTSIFDYKSADFSNLCEQPHDLYVSCVRQNVFIEVDEEGAEAAAATMFKIRWGRKIHVKTFLCNRPFLFAIRDNPTGLALLTGKIMNPNNN